MWGGGSGAHRAGVNRWLFVIAATRSHASVLVALIRPTSFSRPFFVRRTRDESNNGTAWPILAAYTCIHRASTPARSRGDGDRHGRKSGAIG